MIKINSPIQPNYIFPSAPIVQQPSPKPHFEVQDQIDFSPAAQDQYERIYRDIRKQLLAKQELNINTVKFFPSNLSLNHLA